MQEIKVDSALWATSMLSEGVVERWLVVSEEGAISDAEIRARILSELNAESWVSKGTVDGEVTSGVVQLRGTIFDERERDAIRVAAENVVGVRAVHDRLIWIDRIGMTVLQSPDDSERAKEEIRRTA
jgi:osmotically-inducible protein OsmY